MSFKEIWNKHYNEMFWKGAAFGSIVMLIEIILFTVVRHIGGL